MVKKRCHRFPPEVFGNNLPKTKTVWGLTKEEIEFCANLFQELSLVVAIIGFIYVAIALKHWIKSTGSASAFTIALVLFVLSLIPMSFGVYGVNYENRTALILFAILDVFSLFVYLFATINWTFLVIGIHKNFNEILNQNSCVFRGRFD